MATIRLTAPPPYLARYTTLVSASATVNKDTFELAPNSSLCIAAKGDQSFTVRCTDLDPIDSVGYGYTDYAVTSTTPAVIYHRGGPGGVMVSLVAGASDVTPDVRIYGMSQP